jgi:hypothetical protein
MRLPHPRQVPRPALVPRQVRWRGCDSDPVRVLAGATARTNGREARVGAGGAPRGRIRAGTSASGNRRPSKFSTSRFVLPVAASIRAPPFAAVACFAIMRTVVGLSVPATSRSTMDGNRRAIRAAAIRFEAASSDSRSTSTQYWNID